MKALIALVIPVVAVGAGARGPVVAARAPVVVARVPVVTRPLGGVTTPSTRPLGGVTTPRRRNNFGGGSGYIGPVYYVPNAYDSSYSDTSNYVPPPAPPVIVNQYFGTQGSSVPDAYNVADSQTPMREELTPGDPLTPPQSYYLIRYKDRSMFSALTYWLEGDTLHYVTTDNKHNQVSLDLVDLDQTYKLNADHSVPFSIPGR